jgi:hypothetical protein
MAADKISVGNLTAAYIQSPNYNPAANQGWQIRSDGRADFRNVTVSGNIYATDGIFYGVVYARDGYFNGDISAARGRFKGGVMGGAYQGYAWPDGGALGYFLGPRNASDPNSDGGLLLGNANIGHYFQVTYDGNVYAPGLTIINGSASFSGTINIDAGSGTRLVINSQRIEVWEGSTLRVRMGIW